MNRGVLTAAVALIPLAAVTVAAGPLVAAPVAATWSAWWPLWPGFIAIAAATLYAAGRRPEQRGRALLRGAGAWGSWAMPALVYPWVGGRYGLPPLVSGGEVVAAEQISHWQERLGAYSLLGAAPIRDWGAEIGPSLALLAVQAAPLAAAALLWSLWRTARAPRA
ncbi:hypothetical protein [Halorhodospira neutriphila]|uniref:hypothetical protein n=1 Tax=Halorhodospira neutriphila TaxID=168379 RepID=UPI0019059C3E|nr:hypothetical protein [Halorhodospira neutriphila]